MKSLGAKVIHKSLLLGLGAIIMHTACSNSSFRSTSATAVTENASSEDAAPVEDNGIDTAPISSSDLDVPAALKEAPDSLFASFPTTEIKDAESRFTLDLKGASTTFTLKNDIADGIEQFTQVKRDQNTDPFTQGNPGQPKQQTVLQSGKKGMVDIVLVIDNSGSMAEEQANLAGKLNDLLVSIADSNWQINVINTNAVVANNDIFNPNLGGQETCNSTLIRKGDVDASNAFANAVKAGTSGSGYEMGIRQAVVGLRCPGKSTRQGASLAVLIVSDEDNCSFDGADCGTAPWAKENYLIDYVEKTMVGMVVGKNAGFYGIIAPSKAECKTALNPAPQYIRLFDYKAAAPKQNYGNICDASYKTTLNRISENISLLLDNTFTLDNVPAPGTLSVSVKSAAGVVTPVNPGDYALSNNKVTFNAGKEPANGSTIIFDYRINPVPMFTAVDLTSVPAPGTLTVTVNGNLLAPGAYSLAGKRLTFNTQPPANAAIKAVYRVDDPLKPLFNAVTVKGVPVGDVVTVKVNGAATNAFTYDKAAKKVTLAATPPDGQVVEVLYKYVKGPILNYSVSVATGAKNFRLLDGATQLDATVVPTATVADVKLNNPANHQADKVLTLAYELPDGAERRFPLVGVPEAGSLNIQMMAGTCVLGTNLKIDEVRNEVVATCPVNEKTDFILTYKYKSQVKSFTLSGITDPDKGSFDVYYNGQPTADFTRVDATITFNFEPAEGSRVDIKYTFPE
jgi:hypothetical protein